MPIVTDHLEPRVQIAIWEGIITLDDLIRARDEMRRSANEHGYDTYVQIIDTKQLDLLKPRATQLKSLLDNCDHTIAYIVIDGPYFSRVATHIMRRITNHHFDSYDALPDALDRARQILAQAVPKASV